MFDWLRSLWPLPAERARQKILARQDDLPRRLRARGRLDLSRQATLRALPSWMRVDSLDVSDCPRLESLPSQLRCAALIASRAPWSELPDDWEVAALLDVEGSVRLRTIPPWRLEALNARGCVGLERLPEGLEAAHVDLAGCARLINVPRGLALAARRLSLRDCASLRRLPDEFGPLEWLDVSGCQGLDSLPDGIRVRSWIDVGGSGLTGLPRSLRSVRVHWRGVPVPDRIAFDPESITVDEILTEPNAMLRRVLLDRVGLEWFIERAEAQVLDADHDVGGDRRLLRVPMRAGEDMYCVAVTCPSTGHRYFLRVPPHMKNCRQAVAWTAGFANPDNYRPEIET